MIAQRGDSYYGKVLRFNDDGSVLCSTCGSRYQLPGPEGGDGAT